MSLVGAIDEKFYKGIERHRDEQMFRERILAVISPQSPIQDLDAGAGIVEAMNFRDIVPKVSGVDLAPRVTANLFFNKGLVSDAGSIPYPDETFDVVFADNVMVHLDKPELVFAQIARVLRDGKLLFKTPNRNRYMPLIARFTPHGFHQWINRRRGRKEVDTFPTRYLCNSPTQVRAVASAAGLQVDRLELIEGRPEYLRINAVTYLAGLAYERIVNAAPVFARLRILMIATLTKPVSR